MIGAVVDDVGAWVWVAAGFVTVMGGIYATSRWFKTQFRQAAVEANAPQFAILEDKIDHLHDCIERVGNQASANRAAIDANSTATTTQTGEARDAAHEARHAVESHVAIMRTHIEHDQESFAAIAEWRDRTDVALRNIQQGQANVVAPPDDRLS